MRKKCDKCGGKIFLFRKYENSALCKKHFIENFEKKVKKFIRKKNIFGKNKKIVVIVDRPASLVALRILHKISKKRKDIEVLAYLKNEKFKTFVSSLDIRITKNFSKSAVCYGLTIDDIVERFMKRLFSNTFLSCENEYIEPLLFIPKREVEMYLKAIDIECEDKSIFSDIEKKRPGILFSAYWAIKDIQNILNKI